MIDHANPLLAQRRQLLRAALQAQIDTGKIPTQIVDYIDALYARHRDFEAERIAGLALWMGKDNGTTWRETCFEGFGIVLRAALTVLHGVACVAADSARAQDRAMQERSLSSCGLSSTLAARWSQLGQHRLSLTGATLPERGHCVQQLVHWLGGTTALAEIGLPQAASMNREVTSLTVVEQAAEEAVQAIQTVSRCLWHVWVQRTWRCVAPSCAVFLDREVGVGATLGAALIALGQDNTVWEVLPRPLGRLEVVVTLLARATTATDDTGGEEYGGSR